MYKIASWPVLACWHMCPFSHGAGLKFGSIADSVNDTIPYRNKNKLVQTDKTEEPKTKKDRTT